MRRRDNPATAFCHQVDISLAGESRLLIESVYFRGDFESGDGYSEVVQCD